MNSDLLCAANSRRLWRYLVNNILHNDWCFRPWFCTLQLYWARDNLGKWDECCYGSCPWCRIDCSTRWPVVQSITTVPRMPPGIYYKYKGWRYWIAINVTFKLSYLKIGVLVIKLFNFCLQWLDFIPLCEFCWCWLGLVCPQASFKLHIYCLEFADLCLEGFYISVWKQW